MFGFQRPANSTLLRFRCSYTLKYTPLRFSKSTIFGTLSLRISTGLERIPKSAKQFSDKMCEKKLERLQRSTF